MTKKSIEDLFKDSFENFESEVKPSVWSNIKTGLAGVGLGFLGKSMISKIGANWIIAIASSVVTVGATVAVMHWAGKDVKPSSSEVSVKSGSTQPLTTKEETNKPVLEINNGNSKSSESTISVQQMQETKVTVKPFADAGEQKKEAQKVISDFSGVPISSIFPSQTSGTVPLIVNFSNTGIGKTNKWKFGDNNKTEKGANPLHVFETPGKYIVSLTSVDAQGRIAVDSLKIDVKGNPSMSASPAEFTPNGDGTDDFFIFGAKRLVKMSAHIYSKDGKLVYDYEGIEGKWNGKNKNGVDVPEGTYYFVTTGEGKDGKHYEQKGAINLRR